MTMLSTPAFDHAGISIQCDNAHSFDEWKILVGNRFVPLSLSTSEPVFSGSVRSAHIDETCVSEITASAHRVRRLSSQIRPTDVKHLKLSLQLEGSGLVTQDGREAVLRPGDVAIYDTSRPYTLEFTEDVRTLVMIFPHHLLGLSPKLIQNLTAIRLPGDVGIGIVISPFMKHLSENLDQLTGVNGIRVMHSALDLITALLSAELSGKTPVSEDSRRLDMDKFRLYIESHLADPDLNTISVAKAHFISSRYLQYLFREEGLTVTGYIRSRRIGRCRVDLVDPAHGALSVLEIAQRWGFLDGAHFSRVFKASVGITPRDYRATERVTVW